MVVPLAREPRGGCPNVVEHVFQHGRTEELRHVADAGVHGEDRHPKPRHRAAQKAQRAHAEVALVPVQMHDRGASARLLKPGFGRGGVALEDAVMQAAIGAAHRHQPHVAGRRPARRHCCAALLGQGANPRRGTIGHLGHHPPERVVGTGHVFQMHRKTSGPCGLGQVLAVVTRKHRVIPRLDERDGHTDIANAVHRHRVL